MTRASHVALAVGLLTVPAAPSAAQERRAEPPTVRIMHGHVHVDGRHAAFVDLGDPRSAARTIRIHAPAVAERAARQREAGRRPLHGRFLRRHPGPVLGTPAIVRAPVHDPARAGQPPATPSAALPPAPAESPPPAEPSRPAPAPESPPPDRAAAAPGAAADAGPCLAVTVRLAAGAVHRLRVTGGSLDAFSEADARRLLEQRRAGGWPLVLDGADGRRFAAPASLVEAVTVEEVERTACGMPLPR